MPEKIAVISDLDGTIIQGSNEVIIEGLRTATSQVLGWRALKGIFGEIADQIIKGHWGVSPQEHFNNILGPLKDQDPQLLKKASDIYDQYLRKNLPNRMSEVDGCINMFKGLKAGGIVLGITTATPKRIVKEVIFPQISVPEDLFKYVEAADSLEEEVGRPKPDPYTITKVLNAEDLEPPQAVVVGDHPVDVEAGQRAGVDVVVVLTGDLKRRGAEKLGVRPDYIIDNITFLRGVLAQMARQAV